MNKIQPYYLTFSHTCWGKEEKKIELNPAKYLILQKKDFFNNSVGFGANVSFSQKHLYSFTIQMGSNNTLHFPCIFIKGSWCAL